MIGDINNIIDGKKIAAEIIKKFQLEVLTITKDSARPPGLAVVILGNDPASKIYINSKIKMCNKLGIYSEKYILPLETKESALIKLIQKLNNKTLIDGILVQLPLPKHIDQDIIIEKISPHKDVDGFHPINIGKLITKNSLFKPCTPYGIMELFKSHSIDLKGKDVVIIGRSNIVGKPLSMMMVNQNATVTLCHSNTKKIKEKTLQADILIVAVGKENFLTEDMVKNGSIVIDVGINRNQLGKLCGDVDFINVSKKAALITPVPGGVGPMTIAMLMKNSIKARKKS